MSQAQVIFRNFKINNLTYSVDENAEHLNSESEQISYFVDNIKLSVDNDLTNVFVSARVMVHTTLSSDEKEKPVNYRKVEFDFLGRLSTENATTADELAKVMSCGGLHIALAHVRDAVKGVTSVDDRKPIYIADRPFPVRVDMNKQD